MEKLNIVVWFSCGAASAVAAKKTIEIYGKNNLVTIVNNPIDEEDKDNLRFLKDCENWLGQKIVIAKNDKAGTTSAVEIWNRKKYMSGIKGAPCTTILKKGARLLYETNNKVDFHVLGFTADEQQRAKRFKTFERANTLPVLIDLNITKKDCFQILQSAGIKLPEIYYKGFPNANCIGCVKATSASYWNLVRREYPEIFTERLAQSERLKVKLVRHKGKRIFLSELDEEAKGRKIKAPECGIFCEIPFVSKK
jgi:3'-phosphoadenosine 5'-phosphosulfate sulfotransferase (PAPS reductase)/FAD synthetase